MLIMVLDTDGGVLLNSDMPADPAPADSVHRAHLRDPADTSHVIHRYPAGSGMADIVRRYWIPVWSTTTPTAQRVLQYPVCLIVISDSYARLVGPTTGLSTRELSGSGWAFGVMLQPTLGSVLIGGSVQSLTNTFLDLAEVPPLAALIDPIRSLMAPAPSRLETHQRAISECEQAVRAVGRPDSEGLLVNEIVEWTESDPHVLRVGQICQRFNLTERRLQRLLQRRIGLSPKWLINRRRLHDASERLQSGQQLAQVAADLGYTDQAHFTRDWRTVTGLTPGAFAARFST